MRIEYTIGPAPTRVRLDLFDVAGRRIRSFVDAPAEVGRHEINWNRRDSRGLRVARGVYLVRLHTDDVQVSRKVVVASP
jgi:hypothetical protein